MGTAAHRRRLSFPALLIILVFTALPAPAAEQNLSLAEALAFALAHNGDLAAAREEQALRVAAGTRADLLPNPTLELEGASGALTGSRNESGLAVGISQEFLLAGKRDKRRAVAGQEREASRWQLADRERLLRDEVATAFVDLLLSRERLALAERAIGLNRQLLQVAGERLAAGDIPELELNLVKVELARSLGAQLDLARAQLRSAARLGTLMGLAAGDRPVPAGSLETAVSAPAPLVDLKQRARQQRPDLKALEAEAVKGEAEVALARAEAVPNLTAGLVARRDATAMEVGGVEGKETAYSIGLKLSLPLPLFDRNRAGIQEAGARKSSSDIRLAVAVRDLEREVETAYAGFRSAMDLRALYAAEILPQLEENLRLTREAYGLGEVGILAVIREQQNFAEVSDGYLTALASLQTAAIKLESAVAAQSIGGGQ